MICPPTVADDANTSEAARFATTGAPFAVVNVPDGSPKLSPLAFCARAMKKYWVAGSSPEMGVVKAELRVPRFTEFVQFAGTLPPFVVP